jgi:DNA-binding PadR family transcriptional regulator
LCPNWDGNAVAMIQDAVVGLLAREENHGYALWQTLRAWSPDPESIQASSVYNAVKRLSDAGIVAPVTQPAAAASVHGDRLRVTFRLTQTGWDRYARWLTERPASADDVRLRIALARPGADLGATIEWVVRALAETQQRLGALGTQHPALTPSEDADAAPWDHAAALAVSRLAFRELSARAQWLAEAHTQLQAIAALAAR